MLKYFVTNITSMTGGGLMRNFRYRLTLSYALVLVFMGALAFFMVYTASQANGTILEVEQQNTRTNMILQINALISGQITDIQNYINTGDKSVWAKYLQDDADTRDLATKLLAITRKPTNRSLMQEINSIDSQLTNLIKSQVMPAAAQGEHDQAVRLCNTQIFPLAFLLINRAAAYAYHKQEERNYYQLSSLTMSRRLLVGSLLISPMLIIIVVIFIERKQSERKGNRLNIQTIQSFAEAIGARDKYTRGHSEKVAEYSRAIAKEMGLSSQDQWLAYISGILHDVGKIGVPSEILNKKGILTDAEYSIVKLHSANGAKILAPIEAFALVVPVIRHHHERFDGTGYPGGLKGQEIPLISRIIAVADSFEAMTADRAYRKSILPEIALDELIYNAGRQFDPAVVEVFVTLINKKTPGEISPLFTTVQV